MTSDLADRLHHIKTAIGHIRGVVRDLHPAQLTADPIKRAAVERFFEIISEASRHVPADQKALHPDIPWRRIAGIGNHLRHGYADVSMETLWDASHDDLDRLDMVIDAILASLPVDEADA